MRVEGQLDVCVVAQLDARSLGQPEQSEVAAVHECRSRCMLGSDGPQCDLTL